MGDRAHILSKSNSAETGVYLYSHWGGMELPHVVQRALARKVRWDDEPYLNRILFDEMTEGQNGKETGFGISSDVANEDYSLILVDVESQEVTLNSKKYSFADYIDLENPSWEDEDNKPQTESICVEFVSYKQFLAMKQQEWFEDELKDTDCSECHLAYREEDTGYSECLASEPTDCHECPSGFEDEYDELTEPLENIA